MVNESASFESTQTVELNMKKEEEAYGKQHIETSKLAVFFFKLTNQIIIEFCYGNIYIALVFVVISKNHVHS